MEETKMRINKFLASQGIASRRQIDQWIEEGKILVNGVLASSGQKVDASDSIEVNGSKIKMQEEKKVYYLLHKKEEVLSAVRDDRGRKTVVDCIDTPYRIFPIGRLDKDSQGLLFLTNNGNIVNKILRAGNQHEKEYVVTVDKPVTEEFIQRMSNGVPILGEVTKPGEYPYTNGLTVLNAVAAASGFTYRANTKRVFIKRAGSNEEQTFPLTATERVQPGDTIRIGERYF